MSGFESDENENFINQTILLKTPSQIKRILDQLDFNICYFSKGRFNVREFYPDLPFKVIIDSSHVQPLNIKIHLNTDQEGKLFITGSGENVSLYNFKLKKEIGTIEELKIAQEIVPDQIYTTDNY